MAFAQLFALFYYSGVYQGDLSTCQSVEVVALQSSCQDADLQAPTALAVKQQPRMLRGILCRWRTGGLEFKKGQMAEPTKQYGR